MKPQLVQDLLDLVSAIPAAKRRSVAEQIQRLQALLGSTEDFFVDRRKTMWAEGGKLRKLVDERPQKKNLEISIRGSGTYKCSLQEAAKITKKAQSTLTNYLSRGNGRYHCVVDDDVIAVYKSKEPS